ncbi:hypothetical protein CHS0354_007409 [Potamilus streckersoni]|uniref:SOCS box domain-containing protein n=1 Tax=Potamilus streckersoni TaxID=2493646 RepID=A0AAE0SR33_9BIVA|nr:hypothetical protein CHS0354_007409 [Potamilus streckersoni]
MEDEDVFVPIDSEASRAEFEFQLYEKLPIGRMTLDKFLNIKRYWNQEIFINVCGWCSCAESFENGNFIRDKGMEMTLTCLQKRCCSCYRPDEGEETQRATIGLLHLLVLCDQNLALTQMLIQSGYSDVNAYTAIFKFSPLYFAVSKGAKNVVRLLLHHNADVNHIVNKVPNSTALHKAIATENEDIVEMLLQTKDINVNLRSKNDDTALNLAVTMDKFVLHLLEAGALPKLAGPHGHTCLMYAAVHRNADTSKLLITYGADVNAKNDQSETAILYAIFRDDLNLVKILLEAGTDPNTLQSTDEKNSILLLTAYDGQYDFMKTIIDHGADVNLENSMGYTPMHISAWNGYLDCVKLLLEHGAKHDNPTKDKNTPLALACHGNHPNVVEFLLPLGCNINNADKDLDTALIYATYNGMTSSVRSLLKFGADPNQVNRAKCSPLWNAVYIKHKEIVKLLLVENVILETPSVGSDQQARSNNPVYIYPEPKSPLWVAASRGATEILLLLISAGYDIYKEKWLYNGNFPDEFAENNVDKILLKYASSPPRLLSLCRNFVRKRFGRNVIQHVKSLDIPPTLKSYITMKALTQTN